MTDEMTDEGTERECFCGSTETVDISDERQTISICAQCGDDRP